jgi:aspartyl/asparaginyl beta-hydroxylase (cupin superfamily)
MALIDLVEDPAVAAAIVGEALLAREFLAAPVDRIVDGVLDRSTARPPGRSCKVLFEGLEARPFHDAGNFALAREIESSWDTIRGELRAACDRGPFSVYRQTGSDFTDAGHWSTINLLLPAGRLAPHASLCPKTADMLRVSDEFCEVGMISRLTPGGHIRPHCGPWNARLVAHVGIATSQAAQLRVASQWRRWNEGRTLIFDDSFEHECRNNAPTDRLVLLFAIWHPGWLEHERALLRNIERHLAGIYWEHERPGFLKQFDGFATIVNGHRQRALWPTAVRIPSGWATADR